MLVIRFKPSRRLALALTLAHFTAIVLLWPLALPVAVKLGASMLLGASLAFYLRCYAWLVSPGSIIGVELSGDMTCMLETRQGKQTPCTLLGSSFVAPYLTVLELKPLEPLPLWQRVFASPGIVILPDGIDPEQFRQLRVLLRWKWKDAKGKDQKGDQQRDQRGLD
ncbi:MAG TPA: protein YgfX [Nitrosospira sp.]|nr:protein YgfX [Nitrosospira sp.]